MATVVKQVIPAIIAILVCVLVLFNVLGIRAMLVEWAVIVTAFAFILGMLNVARVHLKKIGQGQVNSLALLIAAIASLLITILPYVLENQELAGLQGAMFNYLIGPIGASLGALMVFTLSLAAFRMLRVRRDWQAIVFILVAAFTLISSIPILNLPWEPIALLRTLVVDVAAIAGMRGLLLGVVLGTVVTAIRAFWPRSAS